MDRSRNALSWHFGKKLRVHGENAGKVQIRLTHSGRSFAQKRAQDDSEKYTAFNPRVRVPLPLLLCPPAR